MQRVALLRRTWTVLNAALVTAPALQRTANALRCVRGSNAAVLVLSSAWMYQTRFRLRYRALKRRSSYGNKPLKTRNWPIIVIEKRGDLMDFQGKECHIRG
jgi:hypothetical protein